MSVGKRILIIAGPNGAGKSTFANEYLVQDAHCRVFVNADLIAAGLSPFQPERVAMRVRQGGHGVPEEVIRRRFESGLANFHGIYSKLVDAWVLYDNSGPGFKMIAWSDPQ